MRCVFVGGVMQGASEKSVDAEQVPKLAPDWETRGASLGPEEGFLLSRIDGVTSWNVLRQIAGVSPDQVDRCMERLVKEGLVVLEKVQRRSVASVSPARTVVPDAPEPGLEVDPSLGIAAEVQEQILAFEPRLEGSYHDVLGVARDASTKDIKRAYFEHSKVFHPDRYFGRDVGPFSDRLDRIFKKVALAYELLMDPTTRAEVERNMPPPMPQPIETPEPGSPPRAPTRLERLARLRQQFRIPEKVLAERRFKARQFVEAARVARHQAKWTEAASSIRLAIAFDPWNDDYKEEFAGIQAEVNQLRAVELLEQAKGAWDDKTRKQALRLLEEAMGYKPGDVEIHLRAAEVAVEVEDPERALEYAERACEIEPENAACQLALAKAYGSGGQRKRALEALEKARNLNPGSADILEELKRLRQRPGRSMGGES